MNGTDNNAHLKPYEAAARIYCAKIGVDPDATVKERHPFIAGLTRDVPAWHGAASQLIELSLMLSAMKEAAGSQPKVLMS